MVWLQAQAWVEIAGATGRALHPRSEEELLRSTCHRLGAKKRLEFKVASGY